jgi:hypothetical protein
MLHDVKQLSVDVYIKVTEKSLIMSVTTEQAHYVKYQLALLVGTQTAFVNHLLNLVNIKV